MPDSVGWIKLHRKFLESPLWNYSVVSKQHYLIKFWVLLLLHVNYEEKKWYDGKQEISIPAGSIVTSIQNLAEMTHLTVSQIRTGLKHLVNMQMITNQTTSKWTLIQVLNWEKYQSNDKPVDKVIANQWQTDDKPIATTKEYKEVKKERTNIPSISPLTFSDEVLEELKTKFPLKDVEGEIDKAQDYIASKGKKYKDYLAFMRNWLRNSNDVRSVARTAPVEVEEEVDHRDDPEYQAIRAKKFAEGRAMLAAKLSALQEAN